MFTDNETYEIKAKATQTKETPWENLEAWKSVKGIHVKKNVNHILSLLRSLAELDGTNPDDVQIRVNAQGSLQGHYFDKPIP